MEPLRQTTVVPTGTRETVGTKAQSPMATWLVDPLVVGGRLSNWWKHGSPARAAVGTIRPASVRQRALRMRSERAPRRRGPTMARLPRHAAPRVGADQNGYTAGRWQVPRFPCLRSAGAADQSTTVWLCSRM